MKRVRAKYSFIIETEVPDNYDKEKFEFNRNMSGYCSDNALIEIQRFREQEGGCLCEYFDAEFIEEVKPKESEA